MERAGELDLKDACLLLWQGPIPPPALREKIDAFVDVGGSVMYLPSRQGSAGEHRGVQWGTWVETVGEHEDSPVSWREDADLTANTGDGRGLPLGRIKVYQSCTLTGPGTVLARLVSERPLLLRAPTNRGGVYFLSTLPVPESSNLAQQGIVLVAMVQRALEAGVQGLRPGTEYDAGADLGDSRDWHRVLGTGPDVVSSEQHLFPGVLRRGERSVALNRPAVEDAKGVVNSADLEHLFEGIDLTVSAQESESGGSLVEEIWKLFVVLVVVALLGESVLSLIDMGRRLPT
jgi:hypothetical protein